MKTRIIWIIALFLLVSSVTAATDEQLKYYWTFNETLVDNIGGETFTTSANINYTGGQMNSSLQSEGNGYVENSNFPNIQWNNYTLGFFLYIPSKPSAEGYYLDMASTTPDKKIYIRQEATNEFLFTHYTPASVSITLNAGDYDIGKWYHFVMGYDNVNLCLYKDGKKYNCVADTGNLMNPGATPELIVLGNIDVDKFAPAGTKIDDLRIYDRNLTISEILEWNNTQRPGEQPLTVRAYNVFNNSIISSFAADINGTNYSTSTGLIETTIDNSAAIINITVFNATGYQDQTLYNTTASGSKLFYLYPTTSINITIKDEQTKAIIDNYNVSIEILGNYNSYNTTTDTGTYFKQIITPDNYTIRFGSGDIYPTKFYETEIKTIDTVGITLYLINETYQSDVIITVYDQLLYNVENAKVEIYRYDPAENGYYLTEVIRTNFQGQAVAHLILNDEFYKFRIITDGETRLFTSGTYIFSTTLEFQINTEDPFNQAFNTWRDVSYSLNYTNSTNSVTFIWLDDTGTVTQGCLKVYETGAKNKVLVNSSCLDSASGTITFTGYNTTNQFYEAIAELNIPGGSIEVLDKLGFGGFFYNPGGAGLFLYLIVQISFVFFFAFNLSVGALLLPFPMVIFKFMGFIPFAWSFVISFVIVSIIVAIVLRNNS